MLRPKNDLVEMMEAGRALPTSHLCPTDEQLTAAILAAGFTTCNGKPYGAPRETAAATLTPEKQNIRVWPAGSRSARKKK